LTQRSRVLGAVIGLLLLALFLSACGSAPVAQNWPGLTVEGGTVYAISGSPQQVYMLDAETGAVKGTFAPQVEAKGVVYWSPVTVGGGLAFVGYAEEGGQSAGLFAFDPETGQEQWYVPAGNLILPAPTYADGVVYFGDSGGHVYAVDPETKNIKPGWPFEAKNAVWASPLVAEGRVYVAAMDHHLYSLDADSGELIWEQNVGGAMAASPLLEDGILYVGAFDGKMHAFRADTGERVEAFDFQAENWIWSEALLADGKLYVTSLDGRLYALDPASGQVLSSYDSGEISGGKDSIRAAPVQAGEAIVVATESGRVISVENLQQRQIWPTGVAQSAIYTTPMVSGDKIYVILVSGQVQALETGTGASVPGWPFPQSESQ
jgi:outer membrane protein assembly factor BamB